MRARLNSLSRPDVSLRSASIPMPMNVPQNIQDALANSVPPPVETEWQQRRDDGAESPSGSKESPPFPSPGRTPPASLAKRSMPASHDTPRRVAARREFGEASPTSSSAGSPNRKIWMRPCNDCGHELHVRRTKCTECGSMQTSKRTLAATKEEEERTQEEEATAARLLAEAEAAASQLALIAETMPPPQPGHRDAAALLSAQLADSSSSAPVPAAGSMPDAAKRAKELAEAVKHLKPEQLTKLRRLFKLKALLAKVPKGVSSGASAGEAADALAQLASVACM